MGRVEIIRQWLKKGMPEGFQPEVGESEVRAILDELDTLRARVEVLERFAAKAMPELAKHVKEPGLRGEGSRRALAILDERGGDQKCCGCNGMGRTGITPDVDMGFACSECSGTGRVPKGGDDGR